jgi:anaerobic selenocysteine-containing dehydrogenase
MDAGEWAQQTDFGELRMSDPRDLANAGAVVLWGRNLHTASPHSLPEIEQLRKRGAPVVLIDPLPTRSRSLAARVLQPRPGRDGVLALAVARVMFEQGWVDPRAERYCDGFESFRALCMQRSVEQAAILCDVAKEDIHALARLYAEERPVATLIGGGLQRWVDGAESVRCIDALCVVSGNVGVSGGGAWFETPRRRGLRLPSVCSQRALRAAFLGEDLEQTTDPPIRFGWIQRCNPVAQFPDANRIERALRSLDFLVVVDAFLTDTADCAHVILPPALMLECEDLVGAYGHHRIGLARRVVAPPAEARTDLEIAQGLALRVGHLDVVAGTMEAWIDRMLAPLGIGRDALLASTVDRPGERAVAFEGQRFATSSGRANLITAFDPQYASDPGAFPMHLLSVAPIEYQASQIPPEAQQGLPEVFAHPQAPGVALRKDGDEVLLRSSVSQLRARLRVDPLMRRDTVLMYRGGWLRHGHCVNALIAGRESRHGGCAAYFDERVRLE